MGDGAHPYLPVGRLIHWHDRLDEALAEARASNRRVLLVHGRATCGGTRALVEKTLAKEEIAEFLNGHFVALAGDADHPAAGLEAIVAGLARREPTPLCVYLGADGAVLSATAGGRPPAVLLNDMLDASTRK